MKTIILFLTILLAASAKGDIIIDEAILVETKVCSQNAVIAYPCDLYNYKGHLYVVGYLKESRKVFVVEELFPDGSSRVLYRTAYVHETKS